MEGWADDSERKERHRRIEHSHSLSSLESLQRRRSPESVWCMLPVSDGRVGRYAVCLGV